MAYRPIAMIHSEDGVTYYECTGQSCDERVEGVEREDVDAMLDHLIDGHGLTRREAIPELLAIFDATDLDDLGLGPTL